MEYLKTECESNKKWRKSWGEGSESKSANKDFYVIVKRIHNDSHPFTHVSFLFFNLNMLEKHFKSGQHCLEKKEEETKEKQKSNGRAESNLGLKRKDCHNRYSFPSHRETKQLLLEKEKRKERDFESKIRNHKRTLFFYGRCSEQYG